MEVCNHCKRFYEEGKFLILYNTGQRDWCQIGLAMLEVKDMGIAYVAENNLTWDMLGYCFTDNDSNSNQNITENSITKIDTSEDNTPQKTSYISADENTSNVVTGNGD
jgi:hypothetical protein